MNAKLNKNLQRIKDEAKALGAEYAFILGRFKYVTLWGMKSRVPIGKQGMGYPDNNELFHLLTAFIEELFDKAPRICAYATEAAMAIGFLVWVKGLIP